MLYINQNNYAHIHYEHNLDAGGVSPEKQNVKTAGCGLCCVTMVINHLTTKRFTIRDAVRIAGKTGANRNGIYRAFLAEGKDSLTVKIEIFPAL